MQVRVNVQYTLEGLGLVDSQVAAAEEKAVMDVEVILKPFMNVTWASGLAENN